MPTIVHNPQGDPCAACGKPSAWHKGAAKRTPADRTYQRAYRKTHPNPKNRSRIIGIDGEGQGRFPHLYNYLCAGDENGEIWELGDSANKRLGTAECLDFIIDLPTHSLVFGFAFLYDLTKILTDLDDASLYLLFHEQKRARVVHERGKASIRYTPIDWPSSEAYLAGTGFRLNFMNRKFSVAKGHRRATVWDIFAFFQSKFTKALVDWQIGKPAEILEMERMKDQRSNFDKQAFWEIRLYCQSECKHLATLGRELLGAHEKIGIELQQFYGAGSTAKAMMNKYGVKEFIDNDVPGEMKEAIACAFFGGRFENSVIGSQNRPVWNADINSAYPYAATGLPCLIHGRWKKVRKNLDNEIERARLALVNWSLPLCAPNMSGSESWGPLPVRKADGTIAFPLAASSGWTWKEEFLAARKLRPDVLATFAWVYISDCNCRPFSFLPDVYLERLRIGKDSRGIVLKLGPNSVYGSLVQSVGFRPPFQCWIWGGNITSTCRAQLLEGMAAAPSLSDVLMLATDGLWSDSEIILPGPRDTGTFGARNKDGELAPLGGWSVKKYPRGVFAARPGIYFPLAPTAEDLAKVRARGLGRKVLYEQHKQVIAAFERGEPGVLIGARACDVETRKEIGTQRFVGAKTGVSWSPREGAKRSKNYGEWIDWPTEVSFDPRPKRERVEADGRTLKCWDYFAAPSLPYDSAMKTDEDVLLQLAGLIAEEQPNADFVEVGE
jgi:hypothetical protein